MELNEIATLEDMERLKARFLEAPGCDVDCDEISSTMDSHELRMDELLDNWFEAVAARIRGRQEIEIYRHMTVPDFESFTEGLEAGSESVGAHWSLSGETWSPSPDQAGDTDILLAATVPASSVDWLTSFQNFFSHPWEEELAFEGEVRLLWVRNLATGEKHSPRRHAYPAFVAPPFGS